MTKLPTGILREQHWKALTRAYNANENGLFTPISYSGDYAEFNWKVWLRLRDYKQEGQLHPLVEENIQGNNLRITPAGREYYRQNWHRYQLLYPNLEVPDPDAG